MPSPCRSLPAGVLALLALVAGAFAAAPAAAATAADDRLLVERLSRQMRSAGAYSGAYVRDATDRRTLFRWRSKGTRVLASNTKLFTSAALLDRIGTDETFETEALAAAPPDAAGVLAGDLFLRGGGDPTFGSASFASRAYGGGASVETLADQLVAAGLRRVTGSVVGDETRYDPLRGGPDSGYRTSEWVGPLSALAYNRGLARESGSAFQANPPAFAASRLAVALKSRGVAIGAASRAGPAPAGAGTLASVSSPPAARLVRIANKRSDNFFSELFAKELGRRAEGRGSTAAGARTARAFARGFGIRPRLADGSGLSRANRSTPMGVARLLDRMRSHAAFPAFFDSLPVAGRDGTLWDRMRSWPEAGRCRAKTGTLSNVSTLSGYCTARDGDTIVFSILMNGVRPARARRLQDKMADAIARYPG